MRGGKYNEANPSREEALGIYKEAIGDEPPDVAKASQKPGLICHSVAKRRLNTCGQTSSSAQSKHQPIMRRARATMRCKAEIAGAAGWWSRPVGEQHTSVAAAAAFPWLRRTEIAIMPCSDIVLQATAHRW